MTSSKHKITISKCHHFTCPNSDPCPSYLFFAYCCPCLCPEAAFLVELGLRCSCCGFGGKGVRLLHGGSIALVLHKTRPPSSPKCPQQQHHNHSTNKNSQLRVMNAPASCNARSLSSLHPKRISIAGR